MGKKSAGLVMYRFRDSQLEVFLVHPGGPFWEKKDDGAWSIPKGEYSDKEEPFSVAKREFKEETGYDAHGDFLPLHAITQPSGKVVTAWAFEGDCDVRAVKSNTFTMEWPPHSGKQAEFPEIDRAGWFSINTAKKKLLKGQIGFTEELCELLKYRPRDEVEEAEKQQRRPG
jgi:predicted NUDIX family NTP pyrophosphohydrolase